MSRSMLLLLMAALVLSAAVAVPTSRLETDEVDADEHSQLDLMRQLEFPSAEQNPDGSIKRRRAAKGASSSSEEFEDENVVKENVDSSVESSSGEEQSPENAVEVDGSLAIAARRRRSDERYRNLNLLATICPKADTSSLEVGSSLDKRIEITDMYAICASLPKTI